MDRNFAKCLDLVLKSEGGFSNNKADPGGPTNLGITLANFRRYIKPNGTVEDLKDLTKDQAATCYRRQYWDAIAGAELPGGIDYATFDFAVNSGPDRAAKYLQAVVGAKADGKVGPATVAAVRKVMKATVINDLCDKRMGFLHALKTWKTFGKGWTARVSSVRAEALKMAAQPDKEPPVIKEVPVEVPKPVVPEKVEQKVKEKSNRWNWITSILGGGGIGLGWLTGMDWQAIVAGGVVLIIVMLILLLLRSQIISAVRDIKAEVAE